MGKPPAQKCFEEFLFGVCIAKGKGRLYTRYFRFLSIGVCSKEFGPYNIMQNLESAFCESRNQLL